MAVGFNLPDPYEAQKADIARRQKYAEALQQQAFQPTEVQSYQGIPAPIPVTATLAKVLAGLGSGFMAAEAGREQRELREGDIKKGQELAAALQGAKTPEERQALAFRAMGGDFGQRGQIIGSGEYQMAETRAQKEADRLARAEKAREDREARAETAAANRELRATIAAGQQQTAQLIAGGRIEAQRTEAERRAEERRVEGERKTAVEGAKLPPNVVTTYQSAAQNERQAGSTAQSMQQHIEDIESGKLPLGALSNVVSRGRNVLGMSSPESVRFADFQRDVDAAVNTILMTAKGTQTEGDARRAREQILANANDPAVVKKALADLVKASREAQNIYRGTMNQLGTRYSGLEHERLPLVPVAPAGGAPAAPRAPAALAAPAAPAGAGGGTPRRVVVDY